MAKAETDSPELERKVETLRAVLGAFGRAVTHGEIDSFLELLDPKVELEIPSAVHGDVVKLHGHDEVRQYLDEISGEYVELQVDPREFRALDPIRVLITGFWQGRISGGTTPFGTPLALIAELSEDKLARLHGSMDEQAARKGS
jgi:hypothetical protein